MATLYVTEFAVLAEPGGALAQVPVCPKNAGGTVAIGAGSAQYGPFASNTKLIRLHADAICSVEIGGTNPSATASSQRMAANQTEYFGITPGDKLAVITNT